MNLDYAKIEQLGGEDYLKAAPVQCEVKFRDWLWDLQVQEEPCKHPGCYSHISHVCEGCGNILGRKPLPPLAVVWDEMRKQVDTSYKTWIMFYDAMYLIYHQINTRTIHQASPLEHRIHAALLALYRKWVKKAETFQHKKGCLCPDEECICQDEKG